MNSEIISWKGCPYSAFARLHWHTHTHTQFFDFIVGDMLISAVFASEFEHYCVLGCDMLCVRYLSLFWRNMLGNRYIRNTDKILSDYMVTHPSIQ